MGVGNGEGGTFFIECNAFSFVFEGLFTGSGFVVVGARRRDVAAAAVEDRRV